jgi:type IV secretion system protein TrbL
MNDVGVIDRFLEVFTRYIDSGFGLLGGEVSFIATTLIVIDVTLAALFWTWAENDDVLARLVKKTLFIGIFAYIISNWNNLARIIFESFAGLGLKASGGSMSAADLLHPGKIAAVGLDAGRPILEAIGELMGYVSFFENFLQIAVMLVAWVLVLLSFFILAIQLFVTLIEFKLTTLAGFILIPFGLFGKTAFLAERVLGNVVSSGVKVLVLAVIIGIGSTLFSEFTAGFNGAQPTLEDAAAIMLASLTLLGLGIFGPGIANGIVSGGPQLGAGAAVGTGLAAGGVVLAGAAAARMAGGAASEFSRGAVAGATQLPASRSGGSTSGSGGQSGGRVSPEGGAAPTGGASGGSAASSSSSLSPAASSGPSSPVANGGGAQTADSSSAAAPAAAGDTSSVGASTSRSDPATESAPTGDAPAKDASAGGNATSSAASDIGSSASDAASPTAPPSMQSGAESSAGTLPPTSAPTESAGSSPSASTGAGAAAGAEPEPEWAKSMKRRQALTRGVSAATHAVRSGDSHGSGASIDLSER